ncbi:LXG domain-containing protein [Fictibacillus sp. Mic-4]|uniref:T7SS effector LXG polymorphic toxin n=1 Tax=Fictibacillus sp. Mic-4 TaxID=3132826 RepID=UPI003CF159F9
MKQTKDAVKGIISLEDALKGKAGQAIRSFYQECHLSFLLYFESFIEDYKAVLQSMKNQLKNFEPDPNGFISESFLDHDVRAGLNKIETTTIGILDEAKKVMKEVRDIVDLPFLDETEVVENIWRAKRHAKTTIEQLHAFDKAQTAALETVEQDLVLMANYINQIGSANKNGEVNVSNYSVKQITSYDTYNDLIGDLAQKTNPYENTIRRPNADEQLIAASYIAQSKTLTKEEVESLENKRMKTIHVAVENSEYDGEYHIYADGTIVREYQDENFNIRYKIVDEIPIVEPEGDVRFLDSLYEGTPLEWAEYAAFPATLVKKGVTKLGKKAITGIEKKVMKGVYWRYG